MFLEIQLLHSSSEIFKLLCLPGHCGLHGVPSPYQRLIRSSAHLSLEASSGSF
ncbi:hypothetical protein SLEP1_g6754 [Rubroshorea leprosula]|uniref:Uncharacterized protein n=1 Tax=Rubroshorea leprosula TaxID=152421 RepID=A0AAV5HW79_9ROSI|nr:hypothetical protein SLEP1_g6754 [Rubroshorea leprosula]